MARILGRIVNVLNHFKPASVLTVLAACILLASVSRAEAQNCPSAIPDDGFSDDSAIQDCINNNAITYLAPGTYTLEFGLRINSSGKTLTSSDPNNRPRLLAHPNLNGEMLRADASNWELSYIIFDGNKNNRTAACSYPLGENIVANGDGFVIRFIDSNEARCGSALEINGSGYEVYNNTFAHNGFSIDERSGNQFADGVTIHRCTNGIVRNNQFAENTDIGIVINESQNCQVRFNSIWNQGKYAFAGMHISAGGSGGNHSGTSFSNNTISSGFDLMGYGLIAGSMPWHGTRTANIGTVQDNGISGAVINLAVDSVDSGTITGNSMWSAQGSRGYLNCNGQPALDFAEWDSAGVSLQPTPAAVTRACR